MLSYVSRTLKRLRTLPTTREDRNIRHLMFQTALVGVVNGGIVTFLPVFLVRLGASPVTVSLLTSLPALVTILLALPAGAIASRWRQLVHISARCFWIYRFFYLAVGAAGLLRPAIAPLLIVAIWGLSAIPSTLGNTVFYDILAEAVSPRRRPVVNGMRWALLGLLNAVSVALFGQLLEALPTPANYLVVFGISFVAGMLSTWFYSQIEIPERVPATVRSERLTLRTQVAAFLRPLTAGGSFVVYSAVTFVLRVGLFLPAGVWTVFLVRDLAASDAWIGWRTTIESSALTVGYYFWGRVAGRRGHTRIFLLVTVVLGACNVLASIATRDTRWLLLALAPVGGFFASGIDVSLFEWLLATMPPGERPRFVAMNTALANLVAFLAPIGGAALAQRTGTPAVLCVAGAFLFACAGLAYRWTRSRRKPPVPVPSPAL